MSGRPLKPVHTSDLFVGIDGGTTKTLVRLEDAEGKLLGEGHGGGADIRLSVDGSWRSIRSALEQAMAQAGLSLETGDRRLFCGAGLAGTEIAAARAGFLAAVNPFALLVLRSDGYTSCLGAHGGEDGAVLAVGTGTIGLQVEGGRETRVGGWGFPHGDEGGGAWLGLAAVRRTLQWLDGRAARDPLLVAVYARFGGDLDKLVVWANAASATEFGQIAPLIVQQVLHQAPFALALARDAGAELDRVGGAMAAKSKHPLPCCLLGGLAAFLEPWLGTALRARLRPARLDSSRGAILMIRAELAAVAVP